jgi:hypothetical protein
MYSQPNLCVRFTPLESLTPRKLWHDSPPLTKNKYPTAHTTILITTVNKDKNLTACQICKNWDRTKDMRWHNCVGWWIYCGGVDTVHVLWIHCHHDMACFLSLQMAEISSRCGGVVKITLFKQSKDADRFDPLRIWVGYAANNSREASQHLRW